jgi:hypothetical protein
MTVAEKILEHVKSLPQPMQAEVLDFVEYLRAKVSRVGALPDEEAWSALSLSQAMRGMESEPSPYEMDDLKEEFR